MTSRDDFILIHGTAIAEHKIRAARQLQAEEAKRRAEAMARPFGRLGNWLRAKFHRSPAASLAGE